MPGASRLLGCTISTIYDLGTYIPAFVLSCDKLHYINREIRHKTFVIILRAD